MAKPKRSAAKQSFAIGNCKLEVEGNADYEQSKDELQISFPAAATVKISVDKPRRYATRSARKEDLLKLRVEEDEGIPAEASFVLLNPKETDAKSKMLLKEVLKLYSKELPMMSYAANTGKESPFLEKCVTSGKYCTLLLKSDAIMGAEEVMAAITFQILPPDTQYAEIPLSAVSKNYQHKGFGRLLYREVKKRLQDVGVLTLFCWGDQESEGFWLKQGFVTVAEVDSKGKARKLPIKTDIRRAMCMPGSASLLVAHLNKDNYSRGNAQAFTPPRHIRPCSFLVSGNEPVKSFTKMSPVSHITTPIVREAKPSSISLSTMKCCFEQSMGLGHSNIIPLNIIDKSVSDGGGKVEKAGHTENTSGAENNLRNDEINAAYISRGSSIDVQSCPGDSGADVANKSVKDGKDCSDSSLDFCQEGTSCDCKAVDSMKAIVDNSSNIETVNATCLPQTRGKKRSRSPVQSYLNSSKVYGNYQKDANTVEEDKCSVELVCGSMGGNALPPVACTMREPLVEMNPPNPPASNFSGFSGVNAHAQEVMKTFEGNLVESSAHKTQQPVIMFMNMADEKKRMHLTKIVETLGGIVSSDGNICTHVVTGQVRRTLNFCTALCAGAWVVSPDWLKASFKQNKFIGEMPFILEDKDFESKYNVKVEQVVLRARADPHKLLNGLNVYLTPHIQPPLEALSAIIKSAGGNVLLNLEQVQDPSGTISLACEEDMSEALAAAMTGMSTFTSDWFLCCIMRQELDFTAPQFTESL
eukprot:Gb_07005 [translate_table: standard]